MKFVSDVPQILRPCLVEFIGSLLFIFLGALSVLGAEKSVVPIAFGHGLTMAVLIISMGHVSGGHFNPAVTTGVLISGSMKIIDAIAYVVCQLFGGFIGGLLLRAVLNSDTYLGISGGVTTFDHDEWVRALICEIALTFLLVNTVLNGAIDSEGSNATAALAIGLSIAADIFAGASISGASMNPARSFGPAVAFSIFGEGDFSHWQYHYVYWAGPLLGAALAGGIYKLILAKDGKRVLL